MVKAALLIGVSNYEPGLNPLPGALQDIEAVQRVLQHPEMGEFDQMQLLPNPLRQQMEEAIETLFSGRHKDDLVVLYFSGHGIKDENGRLYLATRQTRKNAKGELIRTTAVAASMVHDVMQNSRSRRQVIVLDCCFSGAFPQGLSAKDDESVDIAGQLGGEGRAVLTSSTATQYSFEQQGSDCSVYTRYWVEGIEKGAADTDNDSVISVDELHEYAKKKVQEAAPAMKPEMYAVKEGYKIRLAKAPVNDPQLEYRKEVERCVREGLISVVGRRILRRRQQELGLSPEVVQQIEAEVLKPFREYQQNLQEYEEALSEAIQQEKTLSQHTQDELKRLQKLLKLRDEDISPIEARILNQDLQPELLAELAPETPPDPQEVLKNPTFGRFTAEGIKVFLLAQEESRRLGHIFVGSEQILLGLIGEGTGVAAQALKSMGVNLQDARIEVEKIIGRGSGFVAVEIPFTPKGKSVIELTLKEANRLEHNYVETGHLLLGLIRAGDGIAIRVLEILGVDLQKLKAAVLKAINQ